MRRLARALTLSAGLAALAAARAARAQCAPPDLLYAVPVDGASRVPLDASFRARYAPTAEYRGEAVVLQPVGLEERVVPATFDEAEGALVATPDVPLEPSREHVLRWPALLDRDGERIGEGAVVRFTAGEREDGMAPTFGGATAVHWDARKEHDECTDSAEERYLFDLEIGHVADDTGPGTLEVLVFQTAGPHVGSGDPPRLVRATPVPAAGEPVRVRLRRGESLGRVCFATTVRDLSGRVAPGTPESCLRTDHPPFWQGCAAAPRCRGTPAALVAVVALGALTRRRGR